MADHTTTPDGRTVDDVINQHYDELIGNLGEAITRLLGHNDVLQHRYDQVDGEDDRSDVIHDG